jgi:uncharacterized integral membrane protein (TIGR00697 family)
VQNSLHKQQTSSTKLIYLLSLVHLLLLSLSNILVQYPFQLFGLQTTWGAFSYPCIFIVSDLTVRATSAQFARRIIVRTLLPGLIISYVFASHLEGNILSFHPMPLRITFACLIAYLLGQFLDIAIFQKFRAQSKWWLAPFISNSISNIIDTMLFFSIAFYHCSNPILKQHWPEIALIDLGVKFVISSLAFLPIYGLCLNLISRRYLTNL